MTQKEADKLAYEIIGLTQGLIGGVWSYIEMSGHIKSLSQLSPKVLDYLDLMAEGSERQVLIDCGVDIPVEEYIEEDNKE